MAAEVSVPVPAQPLVRKLATLSEDERAALNDALMAQQTLLAPSALESLLRGVLPVSWTTDEIFGLVGQLFGMAMLVSRGHSPEEAAKSIADYPEVGLPADEAEIAASVLATILSSRQVTNLASAASVYSDYDHAFGDVHVHVDVRTVFDLVDRAPAGAIVTRRLRFAHGTDAGIREFEIALDAEDVRKLRSALERAEEDAVRVSAIFTATGLPIYNFESGE